MKILMVGHSYAVALNRRICREVGRAGGDQITVTVAAPASFQDNLRPVVLEPLEGEPYDLKAIPVRFSSYPHVFFYGAQLRALLAARPWDIVHAWHEPFVLAGGQIAFATRPGSTLVFSTFQNQSKRYPPPFCWVERYCMARASGWTAFGQTVTRNLEKRPGYCDRPMRTIPLGVDVEVFRPDREAGRRVLSDLNWSEAGPPIVGYLGRFVPEKGLGLLTRVLDRLPPSAWRAILVGDGPLLGELQHWAGRHPDQVRIVTGVRHNAVPSYLNAMHLLAAPSQTTPRWKEQFGRMLLEGMATGVPIVASDSGEIPFVVADAGRIVPEADEAAWAAGLHELLETPSLRHALRERGLARAHDVYAWPRVAPQYLDFFQELRATAPVSL